MLIKTKPSIYIVYIFLIFAMFFWGMSFIWYKQILEVIGPLTLVILRLFISSVLLFLYLITTGKFQRIRSGDIKLFLFLAFFEPFLYFIGESYGIKYISSSLAAILIATIPLFTPFSAYIFHKEKLARNNYMGLLISFIGIIFVILDENSRYTFSFKGFALMLLAVLSTQGYIVILKNLSNNYSATNIVAYQNLLGFIYFIPLFISFEIKSFSMVNFFIVWKEVLYMAILASTFAFLLFTRGVREIGISRANVFVNLIPIFAVFFAFILLNESISLQKVLGIGIAIFGVILTQSKNFPYLRIYSRVK